MYIITLYALNCYEDKYLSVFLPTLAYNKNIYSQFYTFY